MCETEIESSTLEITLTLLLLMRLTDKNSRIVDVHKLMMIDAY
jgi:hypothetical protein